MGTFGVDWAIMKFIAMDNIHRRFKVGSWKDLNVLLGKKKAQNFRFKLNSRF